MATHAHAARPRSPLIAEVMRLARDSAPRAVGRLIQLMEGDDAQAALRACELLLAYGIGKPRETTLDPAEMTDAEILAEVKRREQLVTGKPMDVSALDS